MAWTVSDWLDRHPQALDYYAVVGRPRFDCDHQAVTQAIKSANRELHPYQNHGDTKVAHHAQEWQRAIARAAGAFADKARLRAHHADLLKQVARAAETRFGALANASRADLNQWLAAEQYVHGASVEAIGESLLSGDDSACLDHLEQAFFPPTEPTPAAVDNRPAPSAPDSAPPAPETLETILDDDRRRSALAEQSAAILQGAAEELQFEQLIRAKERPALTRRAGSAKANRGIPQSTLVAIGIASVAVVLLGVVATIVLRSGRNEPSIARAPDSHLTINPPQVDPGLSKPPPPSVKPGEQVPNPKKAKPNPPEPMPESLPPNMLNPKSDSGNGNAPFGGLPEPEKPRPPPPPTEPPPVVDYPERPRPAMASFAILDSFVYALEHPSKPESGVSSDLWVFQLPFSSPTAADSPQIVFQLLRPDTNDALPPLLEREGPVPEVLAAGRYSDAGVGSGIAIVGKTLYCPRNAALEIYALDDPLKPKHIGTVGQPTTKHGETRQLLVYESHLYLLNDGRLTVYDVAKPRIPKRLTSLSSKGSLRTGCIHRAQLYASVSSTNAGLIVFDLAKPGAPKSGPVIPCEPPQNIFVSDADRLVTFSPAGIQLFGLEQPLAPQLRTTLAPGSSEAGLFALADRPYLFTADRIAEIAGDFFQHLRILPCGVLNNTYPYYGCVREDLVVLPSDGGGRVIRLPQIKNRLLPLNAEKLFGGK